MKKFIYYCLGIIITNAFALPMVGMTAANLSNSFTWQNVGGIVPSVNGQVNINSVVAISLSSYHRATNYITYAATNQGQVYYSINGRTWSLSGNGNVYGTDPINSVAALVNGDNSISVYAGTGYNYNDKTGHVLVSNNNGLWQQVGGSGMPDNSDVDSVSVILKNDSTVVYAGTGANNVYSSTNNGLWQQVGGIIPQGGFIASMALVDNSGITTVYVETGHGEIYSSTNNSKWQMIGGSKVPGQLFNGIAVTTKNGNIKVYISATAEGLTGGYVYSSTNNGKWQQVGSKFATQYEMGPVSLLPSGKLLALNNGNIYIYDAASKPNEWSLYLNTAIPNSIASSIAITSDSVVFAGGSNQVFTSTIFIPDNN